MTLYVCTFFEFWISCYALFWMGIFIILSNGIFFNLSINYLAFECEQFVVFSLERFEVDRIDCRVFVNFFWSWNWVIFFSHEFRSRLWHGCTPANQNPSHHKEHLSPGVNKHILIRIGFAIILHGVISSPTCTKDSLLPQDNEDCPWEGEE